MITDLAKMTTGLVVRAGIGPPLRMAAFAAMAWAAWRFAAPAIEWAAKADGAGPDGFGAVLLLVGPVCGAIVAGMAAIEGEGHNGYVRRPWGLAAFLRRAPFTAWCLITDDGRHIPVWAILVWPAVAVVDFILAVGTLVAVPCWGLWQAAKLAWRAARALWWGVEAVGRAAWCALSYTPLDRAKRP